MIRLVIIGGCGQMGLEIFKASDTTDDIQVIGAIERKDHNLFGKEYNGVKIDAIEEFGDQFDCAIDFSIPDATISNLSYLVEKKIPIVIGTTGFDDKQMAIITEASKKIPIFIAPNMAYGINVLIKWLGPFIDKFKEYDIELAEIHHKMKKDAPSGTALRIIEELKKIRPDMKAVYGRQGSCGPRKRGEIGIASIRGGDVHGVHTLFLLGPGEEIVVSHRAISRAAFTFGALTAARFIIKAKPGLYSMEDLTK